MQDRSATPFLLRDSTAPLWEWLPDSGKLFFSAGACKLLGLNESPQTMRDFYKLLDQQSAHKLATLLQALASDVKQNLVEISSPFGTGKLLQHIMVLERSSSGKPFRILARLSLIEETGTPFLHEKPSKHGLWIWSASVNRMWLDDASLEMLGCAAANHAPISFQSFLDKIHPMEHEALVRRLDSLNAGESGSFAKLVHIQKPNGPYVPLLLNISVLERNAENQATLIAGSFSQCECGRSPDSAERKSGGNETATLLGPGQWQWNSHCGSIDFCPRYLEVLGIDREKSGEFSRNWRQFVHEDDLRKLEQAREEVIAGPEKGDTFECAYRMLNADDEWIWIFDRGCVTRRDAGGRAAHMIGAIRDISSAQREHEKLERQLGQDALTGLRSRASFELELERIEREALRPVSGISVDITGLKMINDNLGHAAGDQLLAKAANLMKNCLRASDFIARIGGDEFFILLPGCAEANCLSLLAKLRLCFANNHAEKNTLPLYAACGCATISSHGQSLRELLEYADQAMYRAKNKQRSRARTAIRDWIKKCTGQDAGSDERIEEV